MEAKLSSETTVLSRASGIASKKNAFYIDTAVKTSNLAEMLPLLY
jgi:hypothetical protein